MARQLERESIVTAIQYLRELSRVTNLGEVFALTYPRKGEKYHLHILPSGGKQKISLKLGSPEEVANTIVKAARGRMAEIESAKANTGRSRSSSSSHSIRIRGKPR